jgi:hypothetical protein
MHEKTYKIEKATTPAMHWEQYNELVTSEWNKLLSENQASEQKFHEFFERHPCMLPRVYDIFGRGSNNSWPSALISQPVLPTFTRKIPDFMWIATDSISIYAVLIEIETPSKPWATDSGQQHHLLTQAINQIIEWKVYFSDPLNSEQFRKYYQIPDNLFKTRTFLQKYVLVYGRRDSATKNNEFAKKRAFIANDDEHFMTYDRLCPNRILSNNICVKLDKKGYKAISIPPTLQLNPFQAEEWANIRDKDKAVQECKYIDKDRKQFLIRRWKYWDNWSKAEKRCMSIMSTDDRE